MDDNKKIIPVFSGSIVEVEKLSHDLKAAGIEVLLKDNDTMASLAGFANISRPPMQLCILETEVEKAKPVVAKFKERFKL
jgi:threonyl-tRNA synthetase